MAQPIPARLRFLQHHLLKDIPSRLLSHCLKPGLVLLITSSMPVSNFPHPHCFPVISPAISCFGQTFFLPVHSVPYPHTCSPVLTCHLFSPLVPKLHLFCKTHRKFYRSSLVDEKCPMTFLCLFVSERQHFSYNRGSVHLPCLFLSLQPLPLSPSCTRSVPP